MGLNFDVTAATPILKNRYTKKKIETLVFQSPAVARIPKDGSYGGALYVGAIRNAVTSSVSASDATAFTTGNASTYKQWQCNWVNAYASANITGAAIDQAKGDANALVNALIGEQDGMYIALGINLATMLWGNGGGAIGQISSSSNVATATITLANVNDIVKFYVNQILQVSADDGTGGAGVRTGTVTVTGVNVASGTVTASGNWNAGIAAVAVNDFIFMQGNYNAVLQGYPAWIPNPTVSQASTLFTAFNNVNRTSDPARLAGITYQGNGAPKSESATQLAMLVKRMGGKPTDFYVNSADYVDLVRELGTRAAIVTETAYKNPQIAFPAMRVDYGTGPITMFEDPFVPQGFAWLINPNDWLLPSMGDVPKTLGEGIDGMQWLRVSGADAYQLRGAYRAATYCAAPGWQGCVQW